MNPQFNQLYDLIILDLFFFYMNLLIYDQVSNNENFIFFIVLIIFISKTCMNKQSFLSVNKKFSYLLHLYDGKLNFG